MATERLSSIDHIVVLVLENRSFDHMLGFLYPSGKSTSGQPFDGLTGNESNPDATGKPVKVFKITKTTPNAYFMPGADPGEGYQATNSQLFGDIVAPAVPVATNQGFVKDFAYTLGWESKKPSWHVLPGTTPNNIMGVYTPEMLPVLSGLAAGFAVSDRWFASAPTETMPNRAFLCAATSQGHVDDKTKTFTCKSIFGQLSAAKVPWMIYGYDTPAYARHNFPDTTAAPDSCFGLFKDFQAGAAAGTLAAFSFLEPGWSADGNSQHPNYDVSKGEQLILDVYRALRSNAAAWAKTLLIITYDEHGGCYDHVAPPTNATPPDDSAGELGFDFKRFGVRVPAVLVSPLIPKGTVFRAPDTGNLPPFDHTSILSTVEKRWGLQPLTARDAIAPDFGWVLSLATPRTDDPLKGVKAPSSGVTEHLGDKVPPSHLQQAHADLVSSLPVRGDRGPAHGEVPKLATADDAAAYVRQRTAAWQVSRKGAPTKASAKPQPPAKKRR